MTNQKSFQAKLNAYEVGLEKRLAQDLIDIKLLFAPLRKHVESMPNREEFKQIVKEAFANASK